MSADPSIQTYSYDEVPYPSHPYEASHPDHMYTMARLFNLEPTIPDNASILELGCASGGNLIPIAVQMPNARVVGVDLSSRQIDEGKETIQALGLKNIRLEAIDFQHIDDSFGKFDYILCHGVFSWVPPAVQNRILELCNERLSEKGVAYISYNAYPGWFMRGMIRQMMLHHIANVPDANSKVKQARALLAFLVESTEGQNTPFANYVKQELDMLSKHSDAYLFHDHLEENNNPMFFYQFMEMARKHQLQFLSESNLASMITSNLPPKAAEALTKLTNDIHHRSQYTDFVTNRMFRQTILCRQGAGLNRNIDPSRIDSARFSGSFRPEEGAQDLSPEVESVFKCMNGRKLQTKHPALKALLQSLADAFPASLSIPEIAKEVEKKLSGLLVVGPQEQISITNIVRSNVMQMMVRGDIEVRFLPDRFVDQISERPMTSPLTRLQAKAAKSLTTQRHGMLNADPLTRFLIEKVDGKNTRQDIANYIGDMIKQGKLNMSVQGETPKDLDAIHLATADKVLQQLRKTALLVS